MAANLSAVVLAGGESRRMGRDKAWVKVNGMPLITLTLHKVQALGANEIFISGRPDSDYAELGCPVLHDLVPGFGPLGGIERALDACHSPLLLVLAVDLPNLTTELLRKLAARCDPLTGVVPEIGDALEPLAAIYPVRCHSFARQAIAGARHAARDFAAACLQERALRLYRVPVAEAHCFTNWNRPTDLPPVET